MFEIPHIWAGSLESLAYVLDAHDQAMMRAARGESIMGIELPPIMQMHEGVAVITVKGPMVSGSAGFMRIFDVLGYDDIRQAMVEAMSKKETKALLFDLDSPGGHVAGCEDLGTFIRESRAIKPSVAYTGGSMFSAAYWTGSATSKVLAARTAQVGSIGVLATHMERSRQMEKEGITPTVFRSGKWKGLGGPNEPLSKEAKEMFQAQVDTASGFFTEAVAKNLGTSIKVVDEKMGQGRTFFGKDALSVGLIHGIASFDEAVAVAKNLGTVDKRKP